MTLAAMRVRTEVVFPAAPVRARPEGPLAADGAPRAVEHEGHRAAGALHARRRVALRLQSCSASPFPQHEDTCAIQQRVEA